MYHTKCCPLQWLLVRYLVRALRRTANTTAKFIKNVIDKKKRQLSRERSLPLKGGHHDLLAGL